VSITYITSFNSCWIV